MKDTLIGWAHHTINFWRGCNKVNDTECIGCYAEEQANVYRWKFTVLRPTRGPWLDAELLNADAKRRNTHDLVFTCSVSDFFHKEADPWREEAWDVIRHCRNLIWLILTKRPENIGKRLPSDWNNGKNYPHVWLGVTCGERNSFSRIDELRQIDCALRFISCEPLLEDISVLNLKGIGWLLCGGMSGDHSQTHPMDLRWAAALYDAASKADVPFLFKQVSDKKPERGINALGLYLAGRNGKDVAPESEDCLIRQFPKSVLKFVNPKPKGDRWTQEEWNRRKIKLIEI